MRLHAKERLKAKRTVAKAKAKPKRKRRRERRVRLLLGDCLKRMREMPDCSVDSVVTDPPYGWRFMGKAWDGADIERQAKLASGRGKPRLFSDGVVRKSRNMPAEAAGTYDTSIDGNAAFQLWTREWAREAFRILKPGGHMLVFCGPRTYHRMATGVEEAGFEIRDQLQWNFGSGFPKSLDVSKAIDRRVGAKRKVTGENPNARPNCHGQRMHTMNGKMQWSKLTAPRTPPARKWKGFGTALKPSHEPIVLARKPLENGLTIAENVLRWGCGAINVDGGRIGTSDILSIGAGKSKTFKQASLGTNPGAQHALGRFPANCVWSHSPGCMRVGSKKVRAISTGTPKQMKNAIYGQYRDSFEGTKPAYKKDGTETVEAWACEPDCAIRLLDEMSVAGGIHSAGKARVPGKADQLNAASIFLGAKGSPNNGVRLGDSGGASRFFATFPPEPTRFVYVAKASRAERNRGLEGMRARAYKTGCGGAMPIDDKGKVRDRFQAQAQNNHPCVKPTRLMEYLIRLITQPGGTCLDPFLGSGSTGVAAKRLGFRFIGIEREREYLEIARRRIRSVKP